MNLWLAQYLCPSRHAITASPYDRDETDPHAHEVAIIAEMLRLGVEHRCALCGSRTLHFEHGKLPYKNWDDAWRALMSVEAANVVSRLTLERARSDRN